MNYETKGLEQHSSASSTILLVKLRQNVLASVPVGWYEKSKSWHPRDR